VALRDTRYVEEPGTKLVESAKDHKGPCKWLRMGEEPGR